MCVYLSCWLASALPFEEPSQQQQLSAFEIHELAHFFIAPTLYVYGESAAACFVFVFASECAWVARERKV
jgi:hypothetical protein